MKNDVVGMGVEKGFHHVCFTKLCFVVNIILRVFSAKHNNGRRNGVNNTNSELLLKIVGCVWACKEVFFVSFGVLLRVWFGVVGYVVFVCVCVCVFCGFDDSVVHLSTC